MEERNRRQPGQASATRASRQRLKRRYRQNKAGMLCISCIVLFMLIAISTQIARLYERSETLAQKEQELREQLKNEQERQAEIAAYEEYVTTPEYIEQIAKTKLGLVYTNEIIFKEQKTEP